MIDALTRHQIYLQRYAGGVFKSVLPTLKDMRDEVAMRIANSTEYESGRLSLLLADLNTIIDGSFDPLSATIFNSVDELAVYEQAYSLKLLDNSTVATVLIGAGSSPEMLKSFIRNDAIRMPGETPMTIDAMIKTFSSRYKKDIKSIIEVGLLEGKTIDQLTREVKSLSNNRSKRQAEALVRTIVNHTGSSARRNAFRDYDYLFDGERYVTTLDNRTSSVCISNSDKVFPMASGPFPPLHYNCRSIRVPVIKKEYDLIADTTRAAQGGTVDARTTYNSWLKKQPIEVQNEVLGVERAKAWRKSGKTLDRFIDNTGKFYSIDQLKVLDLV